VRLFDRKQSLIVVSIVAVALAGGLSGCERSESKGPKKPAPRRTAIQPSGPPRHDNILVVTWDTTRADRIGCYGYEPAVTPTIDALAERGTLFEQAMTQAPITLPSHCTIFTGKCPREHGVLDNGRSRLAPDHVTLATLAKQQGYQTGAFVAAYVLDGKFGLSRDFDMYDDDMGAFDPMDNPLHRERPANVVTDSALSWLESAKSGPFFAWVHYFDPHDPYAPPEAYANVGADAYDGEIAFVDAQMRRLTDWLEENKLIDNTLVVVAGDHGESFGEHREYGHTLFLYNTNLHVPLIFAHPELVRPGLRVSTVVELGDVLPTVLQLLNWPTPADVTARSLAPALAGEEIDPRPAYSESLYGLHTFGWSEQRALTTERWKYIASAKPELYDRLNDPGELTNLLDQNPSRAGEMRTALESLYGAMVPGEAIDTKLEESELQKLAGLGYLGTGGLDSEGFLSPGLPDPKDNMDVYELAIVARAALREQRFDVVLSLLSPIAERAKHSGAIQLALGQSYLAVYKRQVEEQLGLGDVVFLTLAREALERVLNLDATNVRALVTMGDVLMLQREYEEAVKHYEAALDFVESKAHLHVRIAQALRSQNLFDRAIQQYHKAIELEPELGEAYYDLGFLYLEHNDPNTALGYFREAVRHMPEYPEAHYHLGLALARLQRFDEAVYPLRTATELKEHYKEATINLGIALYMAGRKEEANELFLSATEIWKMAPEAWYNLAVIAEREGNLARAVELHEKALELRPEYEDPVDALTAYYLRNRQTEEAVRILRVGAENNPGNVRFLNMLAKVLAMSSRDDVRNGREAVGLAEQASRLTEDRHPSVLQTLAAAYAEAGRMDKAIETAQVAIPLAKAINDERLAREIESQLQGYREGRAARVREY
jgi:arylsulfatase A-like enzyme/Tfp pilus assembly protein PilF